MTKSIVIMGQLTIYKYIITEYIITEYIIADIGAVINYMF